MVPTKEVLLSWLGVAIVVIGSIVACLMGFPAGLFCIIPSGIPHVCPLYQLYHGKKG